VGCRTTTVTTTTAAATACTQVCQAGRGRVCGVGRGAQEARGSGARRRQDDLSTHHSTQTAATAAPV
jgi:hypothetical protein